MDLNDVYVARFAAECLAILKQPDDAIVILLQQEQQRRAEIVLLEAQWERS